MMAVALFHLNPAGLTFWPTESLVLPEQTKDNRNRAVVLETDEGI